MKKNQIHRLNSKKLLYNKGLLEDAIRFNVAGEVSGELQKKNSMVHLENSVTLVRKTFALALLYSVVFIPYLISYLVLQLFANLSRKISTEDYKENSQTLTESSLN